MVNKELKIIKKKYGEKMSKLCKIMLATILEEDGKLLKILLDKFNPTHYLYDDLLNNGKINEFIDYIYSLYDKNNLLSDKTPKELFDMAGYILYDECMTEKDIQYFRKYYTKKEELCTFNGGRLNNSRVFFAVKKNIDNIKRENFDNPHRQDEYGTSVISIQYKRYGSSILSIKNRYNSTVENPDATFSNNLDNIIPGLTNSFEREFKLSHVNISDEFVLPGYVIADNKKYYKYNYNIHNIYYCTNNIIIDKNKIINLDNEKYILLDYFILDLQYKKIFKYDDTIKDSFCDSIVDIKKISVLNYNDYKEIYITTNNNESIYIKLDKFNKIEEYVNNIVDRIGNYFLFHNNTLKILALNNITIIGDYFLDFNETLETLSMEKVKIIGDYFLHFNKNIKYLNIPSNTVIGRAFLYFNKDFIQNTEYLKDQKTLVYKPGKNI